MSGRLALRSLPAIGLAGLLVALLVLPVAALVVASSPGDLLAGINHPLFWPALALTARTSLISLVIILLTGTPLAWWLATTRRKWARLVETLVDLPIVIPPAVVGVALLQAYGRSGLFGELFVGVGLQIPFTTIAVVIAQVVVAAPFFVSAATSAFREIDADLLLVARTLGASPQRTFLRVTLPLAAPGLLSGAALCWARAIGEFGATLLFAGNLGGITQTMPLAIYTALESDLRAALSLSLVLGAAAIIALLGLRRLPRLLLAVGREEG